MLLEKNLYLQLTKLEKKKTLYKFWAKLASVCTNVCVTYLQRVSSVFSVFLAYTAYASRMMNVWVTYYLYARIRCKFLNMFKNLFLASAYNNVHRPMPAYEERTQRMPSVPLTYICLYERMIIRWHTLMSYAVVWLHYKRKVVLIEW